MHVLQNSAQRVGLEVRAPTAAHQQRARVRALDAGWQIHLRGVLPLVHEAADHVFGDADDGKENRVRRVVAADRAQAVYRVCDVSLVLLEMQPDRLAYRIVAGPDRLRRGRADDRRA